MKIEDRLPVSITINIYHSLENIYKVIIDNTDDVNEESALNCMLQCIVQQMIGLFGVKEVEEYLNENGIKFSLSRID